MEHILIEGRTIFTYSGITSGTTTIKVAVSVLSVRAAKLVIKLSRIGKWKKPIIPYAATWIVAGTFFVFAFQPETGLHLAIKIKGGGAMT